jgi:hypothetical protein
MDLVHRVIARFLEGKYTRPKNMIPVYNTDKERIVYVLPETLQEEAGVYQKIPPSKLNTEGKPAPHRHPGQPHLPRKPKKPHKPEIVREPPPAPLHPPIPPKHVLPPKKPKPVKHVKPPKVPVPSPPQKYRKVKRYLYADDPLALRVVEKYLDGLNEPGV